LGDGFGPELHRFVYGDLPKRTLPLRSPEGSEQYFELLLVKAAADIPGIK